MRCVARLLGSGPNLRSLNSSTHHPTPSSLLRLPPPPPAGSSRRRLRQLEDLKKTAQARLYHEGEREGLDPGTAGWAPRKAVRIFAASNAAQNILPFGKAEHPHHHPQSHQPCVVGSERKSDTHAQHLRTYISCFAQHLNRSAITLLIPVFTHTRSHARTDRGVRATSLRWTSHKHSRLSPPPSPRDRLRCPGGTDPRTAAHRALLGGVLLDPLAGGLVMLRPVLQVRLGDLWHEGVGWIRVC